MIQFLHIVSHYDGRSYYVLNFSQQIFQNSDASSYETTNGIYGTIDCSEYELKLARTVEVLRFITSNPKIFARFCIFCQLVFAFSANSFLHFLPTRFCIFCQLIFAFSANSFFGLSIAYI